MTVTPHEQGSASRHGRTWGARPRDWALNEEGQLAVYAEGFRRAGLRSGQRLLEVGCGTGCALRLAADAGASVVGLDASEALLALARERVPEAELHEGDMQFLPFADDAFDVVAGFNAFFFAADMVGALREAGRVARPAGTVVVQVWGDPDRCDLTAMKQAAQALAPPPDPAAPEPPALWKPGVLEGVVAAAGLEPTETFDLVTPLAYPDEETMLRAMLSPGLIVELAELVGENPLREAFRDALAPYRRADGSYVFENEWHTVLARA